MEDKDIQFYNRPALGYQVIVFVQQGVSRSLREGKYLGIHPTLSSVIEYQYGSRYSYPAQDEAAARFQAVTYCMTAAVDHCSRTKTTRCENLSVWEHNPRQAIGAKEASQAAVLSSCGRPAFQDLGRASHGIRLVSGN